MCVEIVPHNGPSKNNQKLVAKLFFKLMDIVPTSYWYWAVMTDTNTDAQYFRRVKFDLIYYIYMRGKEKA